MGARVVVAAAVAKVVAAAVATEAVEAVGKVVVREMVEDGLPPLAIPLEEAVLITLLPSSQSTPSVFSCCHGVGERHVEARPQ